MSDGMTGWERMLAEQAAELEKLRGFVSDYETTLLAMKSTIAQTAALREALSAVRARIERATVAQGWRMDGFGLSPETLLAYMTRVLGENTTNSCVDGGTSVGRNEADKPKSLASVECFG